MNKPIFNYNNRRASCHFCNRKKNPHPKFDEPIVTTRLKVENRIYEICINCWDELDTLAKSKGKAFSEIIKEKENIRRMLIKSDLFTV